MHVEYDRGTCIGMFQCVHEWEAFEQDLDAGKAELVGGEERDGVFVRAVPEDAAEAAEAAARACPVDAIALYDDDGERVVP